MANIARRIATKRSFVNFSDFNCVIRNKTMTTLDKFNGSFALAGTAFTGYKNTFAVNLNKNTVPCNSRCKFCVKKFNQCG